MADNTVLPVGSGGDTIATDDIGGVKFQRVKLIHGADGINAGDVASANPLPVSDTVADVVATGTLAAAAQTVALSIAGGMSAASAQITGTWVGTIQFEGTVDGTNWVPINGVYAGGTAPGPTITANGVVRLTPSGLASIRLNATAWTSGTATITMRTGRGTGGTFLNQSLPIGTNTIGSIGNTSFAVTNAGTFAAQATLAAETTKVIGTVNLSAGQTVAAVTAITNALPTGANTIGAISNASFAVTNAGTFAAQATLAAETTKVIGTVNLSAAQTLAAVTAITNALPAGTNSIGTVQPPTITKGTQGATGVTTQDLKDAGRNAVHYYSVIPVLSTATDTLQSLTGTKSGATVTATTTPAVVTAGKTLRITRLAATYIATATSGYGIVRLRFNTAGVVAITSPVAATMAVGAGTPATANSSGAEEATLSDGFEFAAGTGIGISVQGFTAVTATAVGYLLVSVTGYEY